MRILLVSDKETNISGIILILKGLRALSLSFPAGTCRQVTFLSLLQW